MGSPREHAKRIAVLGTRGIPARYRGFESFAESLALYLVDRAWQVTVYCQVDHGRPSVSRWRGVDLVHVPAHGDGPLGTVLFDWASAWHAARSEQLILTLGYNTALFSVIHRLRRRRHLINMDGLEWRRGKWSRPARAWLWLNERLGCWLGNHLVADHPAIAHHLSTRVSRGKITMIPYGTDRVEHADPGLLEPHGLTPGEFALIVGRPQPDNSTLEMVSAFSRRRRGMRLAVLCPYEPDRDGYHRRIVEAASPEVVFLGAIYDRPTIRALQFHSRLYLHGHQVGGTNPSLVEALGAGCAVIAHDNRFNRWVAGEAARYFLDGDACAAAIDALADDPDAREGLRRAGYARQAERFTWDLVLGEYERLLLANLPASRES